MKVYCFLKDCSRGETGASRAINGREWGQKGNQREMIGPAGQSRGETGARRAIKGREWGRRAV